METGPSSLEPLRKSIGSEGDFIRSSCTRKIPRTIRDAPLSVQTQGRMYDVTTVHPVGVIPPSRSSDVGGSLLRPRLCPPGVRGPCPSFSRVPLSPRSSIRGPTLSGPLSSFCPSVKCLTPYFEKGSPLETLSVVPCVVPSVRVGTGGSIPEPRTSSHVTLCNSM